MLFQTQVHYWQANPSSAIQHLASKRELTPDLFLEFPSSLEWEEIGPMNVLKALFPLCGSLSCRTKISLDWYGFVTEVTLKLKCLSWSFFWCRLVDLHLYSSTLHAQESRQSYWCFHWRSFQCRRTCFCCMETSRASLWFPKKEKNKRQQNKEQKGRWVIEHG